MNTNMSVHEVENNQEDKKYLVVTTHTVDKGTVRLYTVTKTVLYH